MIDDIQSRFACCGANGPGDWTNNTNYTNGSLPESCCKQDIGEQCSASGPHYIRGCVEIITDELRNSVSYLGSLVITLVVVQIIGLIFSCLLLGQRRRYNYV
ncbi:Cd63 antigen-like protein [Euroglyphus maynei]|uniref:Cd63 antigen-like protein n=1 Tax=Euroglyphus maynei TaxID=6958 RepID=A0A1Y3BCK3_EURMA|nr:Cd63 antigen-like protein [Euroglyphus maynei]